MGKPFHGEAIALLLRQLPLLPIESELLTQLKAGADCGQYQDTLARTLSRDPMTEFVIRNIIAKAKSFGLQNQLEAIREKYREHVMEEHSEN